MSFIYGISDITGLAVRLIATHALALGEFKADFSSHLWLSITFCLRVLSMPFLYFSELNT